MLYTATAIIANGGTITVGTNCSASDTIIEQIPNVEGKADKTDLASISETGSTASQAISAGTYFYLNGTLVKAKTAIASGATFTENTNYIVVSAGGLNKLNWKRFVADTSSPVTLTEDFDVAIIDVRISTAAYSFTFVRGFAATKRQGHYANASNYGYSDVVYDGDNKFTCSFSQTGTSSNPMVTVYYR